MKRPNLKPLTDPIDRAARALIARIPQEWLKTTPGVLAAAAFAFAGIVMLGVAFLAALVVEHRTGAAVRTALTQASAEWAEVRVDGLAVTLSGSAPNEAARFRAINAAGSVVDSSRIVDALDAVPAKAIAAPRFSVEMLRNNDAVQLIGLLPQNPAEGGIGKDALLEAAASFGADIAVSNMLETADYPPQDGWNTALAYGIEALRELPSAKVSVTAQSVSVTAITDSEDQKRRVEARLTSAKPEGVALTLSVSAPRPVIAPFTLRFVLGPEGARFDACSADSDTARRRIVQAATRAGASASTACAVGLGVPTPRWADAVTAAIASVTELGSGSVTFSDADITLEAGQGVSQTSLDRVVGQLEADLPQVFSLKAALNTEGTAGSGPTEILASLTPDGRVEISGRLVDELQRNAVAAFARAAFGSQKVKMAARLDPDLPDGWPIRVLAGLEALSLLSEGSLVVVPDKVSVKGVAGSQSARGRISQILSGKLGQGQSFTVDVRYDVELDPDAAPPPPEECAADINTILTAGKISFAPGSAEIVGSAMPTIAAIAEVLEDCPGIAMEIAGHTDSQGSEGGNQALSQARADAVLVALQGRRVDVSGMTALGYGETVPIADNANEAGRETNRRIEFTLKNAPATAAIDTTEDTRPSVAPTEITVRPKGRPARD